MNIMSFENPWSAHENATIVYRGLISFLELKKSGKSETLPVFIEYLNSTPRFSSPIILSDKEKAANASLEALRKLVKDNITLEDGTMKAYNVKDLIRECENLYSKTYELYASVVNSQPSCKSKEACVC
jgi:hypothetical protein